jgi:hypothetical protein
MVGSDNLGIFTATKGYSKSDEVLGNFIVKHYCPDW